MNTKRSGAFRKAVGYPLSTTDLNTNSADVNVASAAPFIEEQPVKSLVDSDAVVPAASIEAVAEQQDVAAAHPVGDIVVHPEDVRLSDVPQADDVVRRRPLRSLVPKLRPVHIPVRVHTFESFRYGDYRCLWASSLFFSGAFWLQQVIIGWMTYALTKSALLTSIAMGLDALPILIAGPIGGVFVDRLDKRRLLAGVFVYQALLALGFGVLILLDMVDAWHIFAFIFLMGISWVIADPARMTLIPSIVPKSNLVNAFALNSLAFSVTRLAVPAVGGVLLAVAGAGWAMLLEGALVGCAVVMALRLGVRSVGGSSRLSVRSAVSEIIEGAVYIREHPLVLGLLLFGFLPAVLVSPFFHGLIPVYAAEVYVVGPAVLGLLMSSVGAGFLVGTLILASVGDTVRKGWIVMGSTCVICLAMLLFALNPWVVLAYPIVALGSMGTMAFFSVTGATMQGVLPDGIRGRVSGIYIMTFGMMPFGSLAAGAISEGFGAPAATLVACALVVICALCLVLMFPSIRKL